MRLGDGPRLSDEDELFGHQVQGLPEEEGALIVNSAAGNPDRLANWCIDRWKGDNPVRRWGKEYQTAEEALEDLQQDF
jgi:hypothetical protein